MIFTLKPLLDTFSNKLNVLLEELLNLSKNSWYLIIENITRYNDNKRKYKIITLLLDNLIEEFIITIKINEELASKYKLNKDVSDEFPLFNDEESDKELEL
jgi:hypothetical protein